MTQAPTSLRGAGGNEHIVIARRPWLEMVVPPKVKSLPDVLTIEAIARLIAVTPEQRYRVFWAATCSMALRLGETLSLEVGDIRSRVDARAPPSRQGQQGSLRRAARDRLAGAAQHATPAEG